MTYVQLLLRFDESLQRLSCDDLQEGVLLGRQKVESCSSTSEAGSLVETKIAAAVQSEPWLPRALTGSAEYSVGEVPKVGELRIHRILP